MAQGTDGMGESRRAWEPRRIIYSRRGTEETARRGRGTARPSFLFAEAARLGVPVGGG